MGLIKTSTYQRMLLGLLSMILASNLWVCWDNHHTQHQLEDVLERLDVPPSIVADAVDRVQATLEEVQDEQKALRELGPGE